MRSLDVQSSQQLLQQFVVFSLGQSDWSVRIHLNKEGFAEFAKMLATFQDADMAQY